MNGALVYLTLASIWNGLRLRARRLRQPKYLFAAAVGAAYFYFFVFGFAWRGRSAHGPRSVMPANLDPDTVATLGAFAFFVFVLLGWIFGRERSAMNFTEAETMFLFPAPLTRRTLLHYKLLRSQIGILVGAVLLAFLFGRGAAWGAPTVVRALGWWLALSTLNLHLIASSFTRERLLNAGVTRGRRIALATALLALGAAAWWLAGRQLEAAGPLEASSPAGLLSWLIRWLETPPLGWILVPFRWVVRPYLAADLAAFFAALPWALAVVAAHYCWLMRSAVAFEEAAIDNAAKAARLIEAMRRGGWRSLSATVRKRPAPFTLAARGWEPLAFLWKSLLALGPLYRLRTWLIAAAVIVGVTTWLRTDPAYAPFLLVIATVSAMSMCWVVLLGPMALRRHMGVVLDQLEMTKSYPLPGWKIVVGELLTPAVLVTMSEWLLLLAFVLSSAAAPRSPAFFRLLVGSAGGLAGTVLLVPPLVALLLCIPVASMLYFPSWIRTGGGHPGGVEVVGQGLIQFVGYLLVLIVALLPAAGAGAIVYIIVNWLAGPAAAIAALLLVASGILVLELGGAVWWLGEKLESFDLSQELSR